MGVYVVYSFSLVAFSILSLSLIFVSLISLCLHVFLLGFILHGTLCTSWTWLTISFPMFGKFSALTSSDIFSDPFSSLPGTPIMWMLVRLMLSQRSLRLSYFYSFCFLYSVLWWWFPPFCPPGHLSVLLPKLLCYLFLLVCCSLFSWDPGSSSLSLFWILFLEGCLSPLHMVIFLGSNLVPLSGTKPSAFSSWLIFHDVV